MTTDAVSHADAGAPTAATARRLALLGLLPMIGVLVFAAAGALGLRAFAHNNSLSCGAGFGTYAATCTHYSYAPAIALGVAGMVLVMGGGALASYYAMRHVGLPLIAALRSRTQR